MGSVIPLKKSANSAYLELKNLLGEKLEKVEELIEFFVNISRRSEKGMAVMLAKSTSTCRVYKTALVIYPITKNL